MNQITALGETQKTKDLLHELSNMRGVHLKGESLYVQFKIPNKTIPIKRSLGFPLSTENLELAALKLKNIKRDIENQTFTTDEDYFWERHFPTNVQLKRKKTLGECINEYTETQKNRISDSYASKLRTVKSWLFDECFLNKFISEITSEQLDEIREKKVMICKTVTVNDYTTTLNRIFKYALKKSYIKKNILRGLTPIIPDDNFDEDKYKVVPFTQAELKRLYKAIHIPQTKRLIKLAALTGLRHGELFALGWEDIDLEKKVLHVRHNLTREGNLKPPKTAAGKRTVMLVPKAIKVLMKQMKKSFNQKPVLETISFANQKTKAEYKRRVFLSRANLPYKRPEISSKPKQWADWLIEAKIDHRPAYQLRHTYASTMLANGAGLEFLAKQMGHADSSLITRIYGKINEDDEIAEFENIVATMERRGI